MSRELPPMPRVLCCCSICGTPINRTRSLPGDLCQQPLAWHQQLRIVRRENQGGPTVLSGVGYIDALDGVNAPQDSTHSFEDAHAQIETYSLSPGSWPRHYCLHDLCWDILLQRAHRWIKSDWKILTHFLFDLLHCTPMDSDIPVVGGLTVLAFDRHYLTRDIAHGRLGEYLMAEPSQPRSVSHLLDLCGNISVRLHWPADSPSGRQSPAGDLRSLVMRYYRSKFDTDQEMGFARPTIDDARQQWTEAHMALEHALRDGSVSMGLWNRRRIWDFASSISDHFATWMLGGATLYGAILGAPDVSFGAQEATPNFPIGQKITTHSLVALDGRLLEGSRLLFERTIVLPLAEFAITRIQVSSVSLGTYHFITGLHFRLHHHATGTWKHASLGYLLAARNEISISHSDRVTGFELAACARGIQAIKLLLKENAIGARPGWMGVYGHGQAPAGVGHLDFGKERHPVRLIACFDAFKMVGLGVVNTSVPEAEIQDVLETQPVWIPSHPQETAILLPQPQISPPRTFNPFMNMDFAGPRGERLVHLVKIVVHLSKNLSIVSGLSFHFDSQRTIYFGHRGRKRISTAIDGPGGERVSCVKFESRGDNVISVQICTRIGPGPLFTKLDFPMQSGDWVPRTKKLEPPEGNLITGFTAVLTAESHAFQSFGLQYERLPWSPVQSWASLDGVRRIYFSGPNPNREEPNRGIPGLRFDYHDGSTSRVGWWYPRGHSMDLSEGEKIVGLALWLSTNEILVESEACLGRAAQVAVQTSLSRTVVYPGHLSANDEDHLILRFRENHLEQLAHIKWTYYKHWDVIHVLSCPKIRETSLTFWRPFSLKSPWADRELPRANSQRVLWKEPDEPDKLASITAYHGLHHEHLVVGFRATYLSGISRVIGSVAGPAYERVKFRCDEEIMKLEITEDAFGLVQITVSPSLFPGLI
ncbi:hypothetical protein BJX64DRAFT_128266 [Aspergillus heterothallicus]